MTFSNINALDLLGKQVSYSFSLGGTIYETDGQVTSVVLSLTSEPEISINDGDFYSLSELIEFKILDSDPVVDAFEAFIIDNKAFIDSLSPQDL